MAGAWHLFWFIFLELPKYKISGMPTTPVDKWAYFFREAGHLSVIPEALREAPLLEALEAARTSHFSPEEWDGYIRAGMAIQDKRGALSLAYKQGFQQGLQQVLQQGREVELRRGILDICEILGIEPSSGQLAQLNAMGMEELGTLRERLKGQKRWD